MATIININYGQGNTATGLGSAEPPNFTGKVVYLGTRDFTSKKGAKGLLIKVGIREPAQVLNAKGVPETIAGTVFEVWLSQPDGKRADVDGYRASDIKQAQVAFAGEQYRAQIDAMNGVVGFDFDNLLNREAGLKWERALDDDSFPAAQFMTLEQYAEVQAGRATVADRAKKAKPNNTAIAIPGMPVGGTGGLNLAPIAPGGQMTFPAAGGVAAPGQQFGAPAGGLQQGYATQQPVGGLPPTVAPQNGAPGAGIPLINLMGNG